MTAIFRAWVAFRVNTTCSGFFRPYSSASSLRQSKAASAAAMAAGAAVELMGGEPRQSLDAAATVLMNMLGLVCDPVGGLVEYPCQNRNAAGVANALIAAEMALSGIRQLIPFDEMLDTMYQVGKRIPYELRETALGGCAASPSGCRFCHSHG